MVDVTASTILKTEKKECQDPEAIRPVESIMLGDVHCIYVA